MSPSDWQRVREIFDLAVLLEGAERKAFVDEGCRDNPEWLRNVQMLLAAGEDSSRGEPLLTREKRAAHENLSPIPGGAPVADEDLPVQLGQQIAGFRLIKVIGRGASGVVYEGVRNHEGAVAKSSEPQAQGREGPNVPQRHVDTSEPERVAIKVLYPWNFDRDSMLRYDREREALSKLKHPNVARFLRAGKWNEVVPYLMMELIEGKSLFKLIRGERGNTIEQEASTKLSGLASNQRSDSATGSHSDVRSAQLAETASQVLPPLSQRVTWMIEIAEGVHAAHQQLILHRDLKPGNVIIDQSGRAVLTDFGLAKFIGPPIPETTRTTAGKALGTPQYMAPEQIAAEPATMSTDIYGLGGILYFLLTGRPPFDRASFIGTCEAVRRGMPVPPGKLGKQVPRDLETICLKCLASEPENRYATADALLSDLNAFNGGRPIAARPVSFLEQLGYWARRNRGMAALSVAFLLVCFASSLAVLILWRQADASAREAKTNLAQFQQATSDMLEAIGRMFASLEVAEKDPATLRLQHSLLTGITDAFEQLDGRVQLDDETLHDFGVAWFKKGGIENALGMRHEKYETMSKAESVFQNLCDRFPDNLEYQFDVFHCKNAKMEYEDCLPIIQAIYERDRGRTLHYTDAYAHTLVSLGHTLIRAMNVDKALPYLEQSQELINRYLEQDPTHWMPWKKQGELHYAMALLRLVKGDANQSMQFLHRARADLETANEILAGDFGVVDQLIHIELTCASLHLLRRDFEAAAASSDIVEELGNRYEQLNPSSSDFLRIRTRLASCRFFLAFMQGNHGAATIAAENWVAEARIWEQRFPDKYTPRFSLAFSLALLGRLGFGLDDSYLDECRELDLAGIAVRDKPASTPFAEEILALLRGDFSEGDPLTQIRHEIPGFRQQRENAAARFWEILASRIGGEGVDDPYSAADDGRLKLKLRTVAADRGFTWVFLLEHADKLEPLNGY